jgi:hypothetical protein
MDRLARLGLACRGLLYALIGVLALRIGLGESGQEADRTGAITTIARQPFGTVILWVMAVGFLALALWQLSEALMGSRDTGDRLTAAGRTAVYTLIVVTLLNVLLSGRTTSDNKSSKDVTATLMGLPAGRILVGLVGLGVVALGGYWAYQGIAKKFRKELNLGQMSARVRSVMEKLGLVGYLARGAIGALAGIFLIQAAITVDPDKAKGLDATLRAFADTPAGPWVLVLVAAGLVLFAGFCFGEVRWRRT